MAKKKAKEKLIPPLRLEVVEAATRVAIIREVIAEIRFPEGDYDAPLWVLEELLWFTEYVVTSQRYVVESGDKYAIKFWKRLRKRFPTNHPVWLFISDERAVTS